ncbi:MAG: GtrA family protein [Candidatus Heimdallarchaeaceae archaeon]
MDEQEPTAFNNNPEQEKETFFNKDRRLRMLKFTIVSSVGLGINYLILFLMLLLLDHYIVEDDLFKIWFLTISKVLVAQAVAIAIVMVYNYIINKIWTFRKQEKEIEFNTVYQFIKFAVVGASGALINLGLVYLFHDTIGWNEYLAVTIGFVISVITNFILNDIWTFNPKFGKERTEEEK